MLYVVIAWLKSRCLASSANLNGFRLVEKGATNCETRVDVTMIITSTALCQEARKNKRDKRHVVEEKKTESRGVPREAQKEE